MIRSMFAAATAAAALAVCSPRTMAMPIATSDTSTHTPGKRVMTTQFTYSATIPDVPAGSKVLNLWVPLPSDSEWQLVRDVTVDSPLPYRITTEPKYKNRMVYVRVNAPVATTKVTVRCTVDRKEIDLLVDGAGARSASVERGRDALKPYLGADTKVPLGGRFGDIAKDIAGKSATSLDKARALYEHVVATMEYDYKKESPRLGEGDVAFVCDYKKGNCSDLHSYLISLSRSLGIPTVLEYGFPVTGIPLADPLPKQGSIGGYHCWVWFQDPEKGWLPLDASDGRRWQDAGKLVERDRLVGALVLERSAATFSRGRDLTLEPAQNGPSLNYFIYPYAEADGVSVKAAWEVKYNLVSITGEGAQSGLNLRAQVDELRRLVVGQAAEIAKLKEGNKPSDPKGPVAITTPSRESLQFYGFLRLDGFMDNGLTNNIQSPLWALSPSSANVVSRGNKQFGLSPRLTRTGINYNAPSTISGLKVSGKLETDWQNGAGVTAESRPIPRIRHAYFQLAGKGSSWLIGQTWDVVSPLFPSPNDDTLMWNAGNLGDRRAQIRYTHLNRSGVEAAVSIGLTGAVDMKDLDANGVRDGEDSGMPNVQARIAWKASNVTLGMWGHRGWETTSKSVAGRNEFDSSSFGVDASASLGKQWDLKGEVWVGRNLSDLRGGIGQGIDPASGTTIRANGGWVELGYSTSIRHRISAGYTADVARTAHVPTGGRTRNHSFFLHNRWKLSGNMEFGVNYLFWETQWKGLQTGTDHRLNWFAQHTF